MDKKVEIRGRDFIPQVITIEAGSSITWVNLDSLSDHNATGIGTNVPQTGNLSPGEASTPQVFTSATGEDGIEYQCTIHPGMKGKVIVTAAADTPAPPNPPSPTEEGRSDFEPDEWRAIAHMIAAAWVYDMADDIVNVLNRHRVDDNDERVFIRETHAYVQEEWNSVVSWWQEITGDSESTFFDSKKSIEERKTFLEQQSRPRLEALGRKVRASRSRLAPLVERWPNPIRPDQEAAGPQGSTMFPGQSSTEFGKAITVNGLKKPFRDAYMDHQNFAGAAFGIELSTDLSRPVSISQIRRYQQLKLNMNPLHYKILALHQFNGLSKLTRPSGGSDTEAFRIHMWPFCIHGEMDAPHFSWWHWLKFIDAHLHVLETGNVPDIISLPDEIVEDDSEG